MKMVNYIRTKTFKIVLSLAAVVSIAIAGYFYFPYFIEQQKEITKTSYPFSRPDDRADEIKGKKITLKRLKPEYAKDFHDVYSSEIVRKPLYIPLNVDLEWTKKYIQKKLTKEKIGKTMIYVIFDNKDNKLIGHVEIRDPKSTDPGQMGCWLNENYWGSGRIQEALDLISKEYFRVKNVNKYNAHVEMWNLRSYYALKKFGFKLVDFYYENGKATRYILEYYKEPQK
jgi:RimJ/RimL family protein N-acetyltransferase